MSDTRRWHFITAALCLFLLACAYLELPQTAIGSLRGSLQSSQRNRRAQWGAWSSRATAAGTKQKFSQKIAALVFYGRRHHARILEGYIRRNLAASGGLLQKVYWTVNTGDEEDLAFLEVILASQPKYYVKRIPPPNTDGWGYSHLWTDLDPDTYYFKIDDDIMYIRPGAFEAMMLEKLTSNWQFVSANVVNHPNLVWVHMRTAALDLYAPDPARNGTVHAWQRQTPPGLDRSPFRNFAYHEGQMECRLDSYECPAIVHYNFLEKHAAGNIEAFAGFKVWDFHANGVYDRWSVNFFLLYGGDLHNMTVAPDDEQYISVVLGQKRQLHSAAVGEAVVVHYAYRYQRGGLLNFTDTFRQYEALAAHEVGPLLTYDHVSAVSAAL